MRNFAKAFIAAGALAGSVPAVANESYTTRIEPRAYYGATVTIEEGVRVFRPLPPQRQVIVNPGGKTPLSLGFADVRVSEESKNYNYNYNNDRDYDNDGAGYLGGFGFVPNKFGFRGHRGFGPHKHRGVGAHNPFVKPH